MHFNALKHAGLHSLKGLGGVWMRRLRKEGSGRKFAFAKSVVLSGPGSKRTPVLEHSSSAGSGGVVVVGLAIVRHGMYHHPICRAPRRIDRCDLVALLGYRFLGSRFQKFRCERLLDGIYSTIGPYYGRCGVKHRMDEKATSSVIPLLPGPNCGPYCGPGKGSVNSCKQISRK